MLRVGLQLAGYSSTIQIPRTNNASVYPNNQQTVGVKPTSKRPFRNVTVPQHWLHSIFHAHCKHCNIMNLNLAKEKVCKMSGGIFKICKNLRHDIIYKTLRTVAARNLRNGNVAKRLVAG